MVLEKYFLTGGGGTLGSEMIKIQQKHNIQFIAPPSQKCDIRSYEELLVSIRDSQCNSVIHCAALTDVKDIELDPIKACEVNVVGTLNVIKACRELDKKLIFISTDYVFDGKKGNYRVDDPINPVSKYAKTKAAAELLVGCFENHLIIRTSFFGKNFPYPKALIDQYSTKDYVDIIAPLVINEIHKNRQGIVHVGTVRSSTYEKAIRRNPDVEKISLCDLDFNIPQDVSLLIGE